MSMNIEPVYTVYETANNNETEPVQRSNAENVQVNQDNKQNQANEQPLFNNPDQAENKESQNQDCGIELDK